MTTDDLKKDVLRRLLTKKVATAQFWNSKASKPTAKDTRRKAIEVVKRTVESAPFVSCVAVKSPGLKR